VSVKRVEQRLFLNMKFSRKVAQLAHKARCEIGEERPREKSEVEQSLHEQYQQSIDQLKVANPEYASFISVSPLTLGQAQRQLTADMSVLSYFALPDGTYQIS
jgi:hypothetical protein